MKKRVLSTLLALVMVVAMLPVLPASAEGEYELRLHFDRRSLDTVYYLSYNDKVELPVGWWPGDGYAFVGWYTAKTGGKKVDPNYTHTTRGNVTLYAHWTPNYFELTFEPNAGTCDVKSKMCAYDQPIGEMPVPKREGYAFDGWYTKFDFGGYKLDAATTYFEAVPMTLHARWTRSTANTGMKDVPVDAWYFDAVYYMMKKGVMSGTGATEFKPDDTLSRAMAVQILYNLAGKPALDGATHNFSDVSADQWFNNAVAWASTKGIVSGFGDGTFQPDKAVSIEEAVAMIYNYYGKPKSNGSITQGMGQFNYWARDPLGWADTRGFLWKCSFENVIDPATRAIMAQLLYYQLITPERRY